MKSNYMDGTATLLKTDRIYDTSVVAPHAGQFHNMCSICSDTAASQKQKQVDLGTHLAFTIRDRPDLKKNSTLQGKQC